MIESCSRCGIERDTPGNYNVDLCRTCDCDREPIVMARITDWRDSGDPKRPPRAKVELVFPRGHMGDATTHVAWLYPAYDGENALRWELVDPAAPLHDPPWVMGQREK